MKHMSMTSLLGRSVLVAAMLTLVAGAASAATYNLRAGVASVDYGGGPVEVWGYALVSFDIGAGPVAGDDVVSVPGPTIYVPAGQDLTINLLNNLAEATSIVVHGQKPVGSPQFNVDGRVTAFTDEAAPGGSLAIPYYWSAAELKPGTFLYNSGSHPARQVHMGLYGAVVVDADPTGCASGLAAYPGICYDRDVVVIYSEFDPDLHALANDGDPATQPTAKALNYKPKYFLVNGDPSGNGVLTDDVTTVPATADPAPINSRVLLRFVNAGLISYTPTLLGEDLEWVAEDGNTYSHARVAYSAFLVAGKTMDAIWVPTTVDRHPLYDRRLHMTANGYAFGGLRAFLDSMDADVPVAVIGTPASDLSHWPVYADPVTMVANTVDFDGSTSTCPGLSGCSYQWTLVGFPAGASQANLVDTTTATPTLSLGIPGTYTVRLVVTDIDSVQESAGAIRHVSTNLPPVAVASALSTAVEPNATVQLYGGNYCAGSSPAVSCTADSDCGAGGICVTGSYDPDGDTITYSWTVNTVFLSNDANPTFPVTGAGDYVAELTVSDFELGDTSSITVVASVQENQPPNAVADFFEVEWKTIDNALNVLGNDSDPDGVLDQLTLDLVTTPTVGTARVAETSPGSGVYVVYYDTKPGFKGSDYFTYVICDNGNPVKCSEAEVLLNIIKP